MKSNKGFILIDALIMFDIVIILVVMVSNLAISYSNNYLRINKSIHDDNEKIKDAYQYQESNEEE